MTLQIKLSTLKIAPEEFAAAVAKHAEAMREYAAHLEGVKLDAANPDLKPEERRVAFPPPSADPLVEQAVAESYEFAGPTLDEKKQALLDEVHRIEREAIEQVFPIAKRRHWEFREADIHTADHNRIKRNPLRVDDVQSFLYGARPPEDTAFLSDMVIRRAGIADVQRWAARHEHDIADLTEESIDSYVVAYEGFVDSTGLLALVNG